MKNFIKTTILFLLIFTFTIPAFAQDSTPEGIPAIKIIRDQKYGGADDMGYDTSKSSLFQINNLRDIIVKAIVGASGIFFLILMVWGGYDWMFSGGNEERVTKAKQRIKMAITGLIIVLGAYILASFIIDAIFKNTIITTTTTE